MQMEDIVVRVRSVDPPNRPPRRRAAIVGMGKR